MTTEVRPRIRRITFYGFDAPSFVHTVGSVDGSTDVHPGDAGDCWCWDALRHQDDGLLS